ncbi:MAG: hypothetical protein PHW02_00620 [bacterium]|nr:hypothetical protein [bacterium]
MYPSNVKRIDIDEYASYEKIFTLRNIFTSKEYISSMMKIKNIELYAIHSKKGVAGIFPVNVVKRGFIRVFLPPPFTLYFNLMLEELPEKERERMKFLDLTVGSYINFLKRNFLFYSAPQSPGLTDSRHFEWSGSAVQPRYTYFIDDSKEIIDSADRMLKNRLVEDMREENDFEKIYELINKSYKGHPPVKKKDYIVLMDGLKKSGMIKCIFSKSAAVVFLLDKDENTAYTYNICGRDTGPLILTAVKDNLLNGFSVDFHGANTKRISLYKSMFNPQIRRYFNISGYYDLF